MNWGDYLIRRIFFVLITLVVVVTFNFVLFRILPGDPTKAIARAPGMPREMKEQLHAKFGLDKPVLLDFDKLMKGDVVGVFDTQFTAYIVQLLQGNMGYSYRNKRPVVEVLAECAWRSFILVFTAEILAIIIGIILGLIAAWRRATWVDMCIVSWTLFNYAIPTFFLGIILLILFRGILPTGGMLTPGMSVNDGWAYWVDLIRHLILPTIAMILIYSSSYVMTIRASVVNVLSEDYVLTAKAKGLNNFQILRRHVLKNGMLPIVTMVAINLGLMVSASVQVETVFSWPGLGRKMFEAVLQRDYPILQGAFLIVAILVLIANFIADILYSLLDPRVKVE